MMGVGFGCGIVGVGMGMLGSNGDGDGDGDGIIKVKSTVDLIRRVLEVLTSSNRHILYNSPYLGFSTILKPLWMISCFLCM